MQSTINMLSINKIKVVKRDGRNEEFKLEKILLKLGFIPSEVIDNIASDCVQNAKDNTLDTKTIADIVERNLIESSLEHPELLDLAKKFVLARIYNHVFGKGNWKEFDSKDLLLSYNALKVLEARYLLKNPETLRYIETPQMMFRRVAHFLASVEKQYGKSDDEIKKIEEKFYEKMSDLKFLPNTPTLMNSGTRLGILSACFVLPVKDSMTTPQGDGIYDTLRAMALVHQQGGGTGFDFSELRPKGDIVASTAGVASGPVSFMKIFDVSTDVVKQGGKRRGANMGVMHVWHSDIEDFIHSKSGELKDVQLQNFNISVGMYDYVMEKVEKDEQVPLITPRKTRIPGTDHDYYITKARGYMSEEWIQEEILQELEEKGGSVYLDESVIITMDEALAIAEKEGAITRWVNARTLFEEIVKGAWDSGDPGLLFIDTINRRHPIWYMGKINATNPCGEEPLLPWESCNLGSINLEKFVKEKEGKPTVDWDGLAETIKYAVRFLDNVIDANRYPLKQIEEATKKTRKVGLGVMGLARMLIKLGIPYDSVDAIYFSYQLAKFIYYHAFKESIELAKEKGPFPVYSLKYRDIFDSAKSFDEIMDIVKIDQQPSSYVKRLTEVVDKLDFAKLKEERIKHGLRNSTVTSIAPTGTISIIAGTSSSIEPLFALAFIRNVAVGKFMEIDPLFLEYLRKYELDNPEVVKKVAESGTVGENPFMPATIRKLFRTAHEIKPEFHLLHQASWQQWNDSGVSKTINLRSEETTETVEKVYMLAWKLGVKGVTIYRDKSKSQQVIYFGLKKEREEKEKREEDEKKKKMNTLLPSSLRLSNEQFVEVSENYAGGCKTCEL
ncbi:adenosylcobalamin-dependent ribonucleoside-diphosphate reductase [Acidianus sulfidivorans JP7]|uniref:Vitamin B12-dependent ribonucleotide reductase n=1 Tax=Acidianus sulfidivorans JP7 TaxID=619593 RepID=A0A2U9IP33_9CREN|nr:adenosylcobalamin-dependent ribonucleoside-diphosphate reductase [Acidianus sulfidivorans]AWR97790.1 adenosylcobalamin-dependent ribonucleoside-diphosphate reductase [Acidianus sulfidivorans JP7]